MTYPLLGNLPEITMQTADVKRAFWCRKYKQETVQMSEIVILQIALTLIVVTLQVTLQEFKSLMTGAIGGRDPMQVCDKGTECRRNDPQGPKARFFYPSRLLFHFAKPIPTGRARQIWPTPVQGDCTYIIHIYTRGLYIHNTYIL
jgi:hypothetical protein